MWITEFENRTKLSQTELNRFKWVYMWTLNIFDFKTTKKIMLELYVCIYVHYHEYIVKLIIFPFPQTRTANIKHAQSDDLTAKAKKKKIVNGNWINVGGFENKWSKWAAVQFMLALVNYQTECM